MRRLCGRELQASTWHRDGGGASKDKASASNQTAGEAASAKPQCAFINQSPRPHEEKITVLACSSVHELTAADSRARQTNGSLQAGLMVLEEYESGLSAQEAGRKHNNHLRNQKYI